MTGFIHLKRMPRRCRVKKVSVSHGLDVVAGQRLPGRVLSVDWTQIITTNATSVARRIRWYNLSASNQPLSGETLTAAGAGALGLERQRWETIGRTKLRWTRRNGGMEWIETIPWGRGSVTRPTATVETTRRRSSTP